MHLHKFICLGIFLCIVACNTSVTKTKNQGYTQDSTVVFKYIEQGNSIYSSKSSYSNFEKSLELYDTAEQIATKTNDTILIAESILAKGRAYDALNSNPQKTINYYTKAAQRYTTIPNKLKRALYIKHLVAHSYDKVKDSTNCVKILKELFVEISTKSDSLKEQMTFTSEMALISSEVKNYTLADSILHFLTKRNWIYNDSNTYDYLNHYYLTQARIDVHLKNKLMSPYLDSVVAVLRHSSNPSDSMYYTMELFNLYKDANNTIKKNYFLQLNKSITLRFISPEETRSAQEKISKMEVEAVEMQNKMEHQQTSIKEKYNYILSALLGIILLLFLFLLVRNNEIKKKKNEAVINNLELEKKNVQNEILNKEIHHRVKNNLQMIMSLVYMQERNSNTDEVKENMQNIRLRIESIAELHEQLMKHTDAVDLKMYVQQLVANATNLLGDDKNIVTNLDIQQITVPQKISFPLGLILNEWITNSVKYAQPTSLPLTIFIEINNGNQEIKVCYKDNGKPLSKKPNKKSLGLDIVNLLIAQLNASVHTNAENIFSYKIILPLTHGA